jgi:hypothetical protein
MTKPFTARLATLLISVPECAMNDIDGEILDSAHLGHTLLNNGERYIRTELPTPEISLLSAATEFCMLQDPREKGDEWQRQPDPYRCRYPDPLNSYVQHPEPVEPP